MNIMPVLLHCFLMELQMECRFWLIQILYLSYTHLFLWIGLDSITWINMIVVCKYSISGVKYCIPELIRITLNMVMNDPSLLSPLLFISRDNPAPIPMIVFCSSTRQPMMCVSAPFLMQNFMYDFLLSIEDDDEKPLIIFHA